MIAAEVTAKQQEIKKRRKYGVQVLSWLDTMLFACEECVCLTAQLEGCLEGCLKGYET